MNFIIAYYLKEKPELIHLEELSNIDDNDDMLRTNLYCLMIFILENYYGDKYTNEIVDNQEEYELFFKEKFVYNYKVI